MESIAEWRLVDGIIPKADGPLPAQMKTFAASPPGVRPWRWLFVPVNETCGKEHPKAEAERGPQTLDFHCQASREELGTVCFLPLAKTLDRRLSFGARK